jgi:hypothetical protein
MMLSQNEEQHQELHQKKMLNLARSQMGTRSHVQNYNSRGRNDFKSFQRQSIGGILSTDENDSMERRGSLIQTTTDGWYKPSIPKISANAIPSLYGKSTSQAAYRGNLIGSSRIQTV